MVDFGIYQQRWLRPYIYNQWNYFMQEEDWKKLLIPTENGKSNKVWFLHTPTTLKQYVVRPADCKSIRDCTLKVLHLYVFRPFGQSLSTWFSTKICDIPPALRDLHPCNTHKYMQTCLFVVLYTLTHFVPQTSFSFLTHTVLYFRVWALKYFFLKMHQNRMIWTKDAYD